MRRFRSFLRNIPEILLVVFIGLPGPAVASLVTGEPLTPLRLSTAPVIDGDLSDAAWKPVPPLEPAFIGISPCEGKPAPEKTLVWTGYDDKNLYFAFRCLDSQPERIKASFTARDKISDDDVVVVSLDTQNTRQLTCQFAANAHGIQRDMVNADNDAVDWVWYSAGRLTPEGYEVEMAIPLSSLRFRGGRDVRMGILFGRAITREGLTATWPEIRADRNLAASHATVIYHDLDPSRSMEILPSSIYGAGSSRISPGRWGNSLTSREAGVSLKYSRSSALTLEATANPDFSQVESDAFQIDVNRRYPVFYREKRPFFMEGMDIFELSRGGSNFSTTMNTRAIVAPSASAKLTGTQGKLAYGLLAAEDTGDNPFRPDASGTGSSRFAVARLKYLTGGENFLGVLYSGHTRAGISNHSAALDGYWSSGRHAVRFTGIGTSSGPVRSGGSGRGSGETFLYSYNTRPLGATAAFESYSRDFRMDTAFYNRTGYNRSRLELSPHFYPAAPRFQWITQISPYANITFLHDYTTGRNDHYLNTGTNLNFARQGCLNINLSLGREAWANREFDTRGVSWNGNIQVTPRLKLGNQFSYGRSIYYDAKNPWLGTSRSFGGGFEFQPVDRLRQTVTASHERLNRLSDGYRAYSVNIINSNTSLQINRYFFIRGILQYDSGRNRLLQDLLAAFTLIPGTVVYLGYGGVSEGQVWDGRDWKPDPHAPRYSMERRLFFKASYLYRR